GVPSTGARWASTAISLMLAAPSATAAAIDTRTTPRSRTGDAPAFRSAAPRATASRSRTAPAGPTRARPAASDLQGTVPPRILHGEERSSLREAAQVVVTCNLPEPGRSSPLMLNSAQTVSGHVKAPDPRGCRSRPGRGAGQAQQALHDDRGQHPQQASSP